MEGYQESIQHIRGVLDKKQSSSTHSTRVFELVRFMMTTPVDNDPILQQLHPHIPDGFAIENWYQEHATSFMTMRTQDHNDWRTDRHDLEQEATAIAQDSVWFENTNIAKNMFPLNPEITEAGIAIRCLYIEANEQYTDLQAEDATAQLTSQPQGHTSTAA